MSLKRKFAIINIVRSAIYLNNFDIARSIMIEQSPKIIYDFKPIVVQLDNNNIKEALRLLDVDLKHIGFYICEKAIRGDKAVIDHDPALTQLFL